MKGWRLPCFPLRPRTAVVAALMVGVTGCSFAPEHVRPPQPVPPTYEAANIAGTTIARIGWHDFFREAELQRLIGEALANNRDIRIAATRVAEVRAAWRIEGSSLYPQLC